MSKSYQLIVFDWEGTLGDTIGDILSCIELESKKLGYCSFDPIKARQSISFGLINLIKNLFPKLSFSEQAGLLQSVQKCLTSPKKKISLISGALNFITAVDKKGINMAIASNRNRTSLLKAVQQTGVGKWIKLYRTADILPPKPNPKMLADIISIFDVSAKKTLMIGDSVIDVEMAKYLNIDAIGIDFYEQCELSLLNAGAMAVFHDYWELAKFLQITMR